LGTKLNRKEKNPIAERNSSPLLGSSEMYKLLRLKLSKSIALYPRKYTIFKYLRDSAAKQLFSNFNFAVALKGGRSPGGADKAFMAEKIDNNIKVCIW
jgi:hypothetical protein